MLCLHKCSLHYVIIILYRNVNWFKYVINSSHSVAGLLPTVTWCFLLNANLSLRLFSFQPTKHFDHDLDLILIDIGLERSVYNFIFVHLLYGWNGLDTAVACRY